MSKYFLLLFTTVFLITGCDKTTVEPEEPEVKEQEQKEEEEEKEVCGCRDQAAANFMAEATCDDGSCIYLDDEKKTLNTLFTSTGCGACGIWGIDCYKGYTKEVLDKAIPFELHFKYGDSMINKTSDSFVAITRPSYSPYFAVGLNNSMVRGEDRPSTCEKSHANADELIEQFLAAAQDSRVAINHTIDGDQLNAYFAIESENTENLSYAVYVLEDGLVYVQNAGWRNDIPGWVHDHTVRDAITPVLGIPLKDGKVTGSVSLTMDSEWNPDNIYTVLVIWNQTTGLPQVVNAETSKK